MIDMNLPYTIVYDFVVFTHFSRVECHVALPNACHDGARNSKALIDA